ncbi:hypothetical protein ACVIN2_005858 [Bradyrhizobium sp. USDA 3650]
MLQWTAISDGLRFGAFIHHVDYASTPTIGSRIPGVSTLLWTRPLQMGGR